jgi:hypothetical protein
MTAVQRAARRLIRLHGGLRAAAKATGIDAAYLLRLKRGTKGNPGEEVCAQLGLEKTYRPNGHPAK